MKQLFNLKILFVFQFFLFQVTFASVSCPCSITGTAAHFCNIVVAHDGCINNNLQVAGDLIVCGSIIGTGTQGPTGSTGATGPWAGFMKHLLWIPLLLHNYSME